MPDPIFLPPSRGPDPRKIALAERVELLSGVPLFRDAPKRHLRHVAKQMRLVQAEPNQSLVREGEASTQAYLIVAGRAAVRRNGRKIAELGPGDFVGELGLLLDRPRSATVVSLTVVEVLALDQRGLRSAVLEIPALGWHLARTVASRLAE